MFQKKNHLQSVSEIRAFVEKTLKTYQAKKQSLENRKLNNYLSYLNSNDNCSFDLMFNLDMTITEILKDITVDDEFFETLRCQNELLAGLSNDKANTYIMSCMAQGEDIFKVIRLICIHCVVNNGFKPPLIETYKREIIRV